MKKIFLCAALIAASSVSFAQEAKVKEAQKLAEGKNYAGAVQAIAAAISNPETANSAETYAVAGNIYEQMAGAESAKKMLKQPYDNKAFADGLLGMYANYLKCYVLDHQPNAKGKVKPKYSKEYPDKLWGQRGDLINEGVEVYNKKDYATALKLFSTYIDTFTKSEVFANDERAKGDTLVTYTAALATMAAYYAKDYNSVVTYAALGQKDKNKELSQNALILKLDALKQLGKTDEYFAAAKEALQAKPDNQGFKAEVFNGYLNNKKDTLGAVSFVDELLAKNPQDSYALFLKGYALMLQKKYDEAISAFDASKAIDSKNKDVYRYLAMTHINKAQDYGMNTPQKEYSRSKYLNLLKGGMEALEAWSKLDPKDGRAWGPTLYNIYYQYNNDKVPGFAEKMEALKAELAGQGVTVGTAN